MKILRNYTFLPTKCNLLPQFSIVNCHAQYDAHYDAHYNAHYNAH